MRDLVDPPHARDVYETYLYDRSRKAIAECFTWPTNFTPERYIKNFYSTYVDERQNQPVVTVVDVPIQCMFCQCTKRRAYGSDINIHQLLLESDDIIKDTVDALGMN